jgi:L-rhamnose mutarotase
MARVGYLLRIREGKEEEYVREHQNVWPEMVNLLQKVGFRNYTIFRRGLDLFVYVESDDFERSLNALLGSPVYERWAEHMAPITEPHPALRPGEKLAMLEEVFHVD